jgi:hypothetical protein
MKIFMVAFQYQGQDWETPESVKQRYEESLWWTDDYTVTEVSQEQDENLHRNVQAGGSVR